MDTVLHMESIEDLDSSCSTGYNCWHWSERGAWQRGLV